MPVGSARKPRLNWTRPRSGACLALASVFLFTGIDNLQDAIANGDTRTLSLHHTHTDESITVTFKREGRYDEDALKKLNWFLRDWRNDETIRMDPHLFDIVWEVQRDVNAKEPVQIISAYRSPNTNAMLRRRSRGVAQFSQHMHGRAMDFFLPDAALPDVRAAGLRLQRGGVGFYPTSGSPFVHLDTGSVRHWPRMTREQLVKIFPTGRTVHIPTDGHPLPGFALALADIERRGGHPSATTLAAAENAGVTRAETDRSASEPSQRNFLKRLFAWAAEEDDEKEAAGAKARAAAAVAAVPRAPQQVAAAIPLPRQRPGATQYQLASADPSPLDVIKSRGFWRGESALPAAGVMELRTTTSAFAPAELSPTPADVRFNGQRLAWVAGPQGQPVNASDTPQPRPRRITLASLGPTEATASVAARPVAAASVDRVPMELALAYAATNANGAVAATNANAAVAAATAPIPAARPDAVTARNRLPSRQGVRLRPGQQTNDPWLRAVVMAPSIDSSMKVAIFGALDQRGLGLLMDKPRSSLAMSFSHDPYLGMTSRYFAGAAIAFLPTVTFMRTASLH